MRFKITGNKERIKPFVEQFCKESKEEYERQMGKARNTPMPFGTKIPDMPFDIGFIEDGDNIILWNTMPMPKLLRRGLLGRRIMKKMQKNLEGFFKASGLEVKIVYIGE